MSIDPRWLQGHYGVINFVAELLVIIKDYSTSECLILVLRCLYCKVLAAIEFKVLFIGSDIFAIWHMNYIDEAFVWCVEEYISIILG